MTGDDRFWQQILDDHRPRPRELRRVDHELSATPAERLHDGAVETFVHAASTERSRWPRRQAWQRRASVAALVTLAVVTGAFMYPRVHVPQTTPTPSRLTLHDAVTSPATASEADRFAAASLADDHCLPAIDALRELTTAAEAEIASAAAAVLTDLNLAYSGEVTPQQEPEGKLSLALATAKDAAAPVERRLYGLKTARAHLILAIRTLVDARFTEKTRVIQHAAMVDRLGRKLAAGDVTR